MSSFHILIEAGLTELTINNYTISFGLYLGTKCVWQHLAAVFKQLLTYITDYIIFPYRVMMNYKFRKQ